jgi:hypothetical protein
VLNEKEKKRKREEGAAGWLGGCWAGASGRPKWLRFFSLFFLFWFFSFCFLFGFISFAKLFQINSNHFQKFSKIQGKVLNQQQTCFSKMKQDFQKAL